MRTLIVVSVAGVLLAACGSTTSSPTAAPPRCVSFPGEQASGIAWAPDGSAVAVTSDRIATGETMVRRVRWPSMKTDHLAGPDVRIGTRAVGAGENGEVVWSLDEGVGTSFPSSDETAVWPRYPTSAVFNLRRIRDGLVFSSDGAAGSQRVLSRTEGGNESVLFSTEEIIDSFGINWDGSLLAVHHYPAPGDDGSISIVSSSGLKTRPAPEGGVARLSVTPDGRLLFVEPSSGSLLSAGLDLQEVRVEQGDVTVGEIGPVLAFLPAPHDTLEVPLCFRHSSGSGLHEDGPSTR